MILPEYREARFMADRGSLPQDFHIVTAFNPNGDLLSAEENARLSDSLRRVLESRKMTFFPITGGSPDGVHREEGFAIVGISRGEALALGREFRQNAIFEVCSGVLGVIGCTSGKSEEIGSMNGRIGLLGRL
jgi:Protein of unknown function (DUF3293)